MDDIDGRATTLNAVNAASVRPDGAFDKIDIPDGPFITQQLAGVRNSLYNLAP